MSDERSERVRDAVRRRYAAAAKVGAGAIAAGCCEGESGSGSSCCGGSDGVLQIGKKLGYSEKELAAVPEGANLGLGCGNPTAIAALRPGETVLDLGSGGGFDCFLAARQVGPTGHVIGVDMTPEMIARARENAHKGEYANVEFRLGEIEHLPVADGTIDAIISNCVVNLAPDKRAVYAEAFRALKPGGRLAISDVVATGEIPENVRQDLALVSCCVGGATHVKEQEAILRAVGFAKVTIIPDEASRQTIREWIPGSNAADYVVSATIEAIKP